MRNQIICSCLLLLVLNPIAQAQSDEAIRYYNVEVLVFEILDERSRRAEQWPADINRELPEPLVELDKPLPGPVSAQWKAGWSFKSLRNDALKLNEARKLLENADQYRILMHRGWRQPGLEKEAALPVYFEKAFKPVDARAGAADNPSTMSAPTTPKPGESILKGYIRIILSRYLHAEVDLAYMTGLAEQTPSIFGADFLQPELPAPKIYRLAQTRRMRSGELHYLDHPALGILIQITPVEADSQSS